MKNVVLIMALLFAGQTFARDFWEGDADRIDGPVGIEWSFSQHAKVPYVLNTDIKLRNTPERACRALQASVRPDTIGSYAVHVPTQLDTTRPWTKLAPFIGIYGDDNDIFECYAMGLQREPEGAEMSSNRCWLETNSPAMPDRVSNAGEAEWFCEGNSVFGYQKEDVQHLASESDSWVTVKKWHDALYTCNAPSFTCAGRNIVTGAVETSRMTPKHHYCPEGTVAHYGDYGVMSCVGPDLKIGDFHLRVQNAESCTQGKLTDRGTIEVDSGYIPYCNDGECKDRNVYMFADYTGSDNPADGRDGQWDSQGKILSIRYTDDRGYDRIRWSTEVTKDSFRPEQGTDINPPRLVSYMFMLGNGEVLDSGCFSTEVF